MRVLARDMRKMLLIADPVSAMVTAGRDRMPDNSAALPSERMKAGMLSPSRDRTSCSVLMNHSRGVCMPALAKSPQRIWMAIGAEASSMLIERHRPTTVSRSNSLISLWCGFN
jgi:hypothetical protein